MRVGIDAGALVRALCEGENELRLALLARERDDGRDSDPDVEIGHAQLRHALFASLGCLSAISQRSCL